MHQPSPEPFHLLETMRLEHGAIARLERHLARMHRAAAFFEYGWDEPRVRHELAYAAASHPRDCWRLRLLVGPDGTPIVICTRHNNRAHGPWSVAFAATPIDDSSPFVFRKTTRRESYEAAREALPDLDDVILWNPRGEVTESTIANIVVELDGARVTPPEHCGLLPGVLRAELLERGEIAERVLTKDDVARAPRVWLINSLRGWIEAHVL